MVALNTVVTCLAFYNADSPRGNFDGAWDANIGDVVAGISETNEYNKVVTLNTVVTLNVGWWPLIWCWWPLIW